MDTICEFRRGKWAVYNTVTGKWSTVKRWGWNPTLKENVITCTDGWVYRSDLGAESKAKAAGQNHFPVWIR